jgi:biopolymer transport protein ExbD
MRLSSPVAKRKARIEIIPLIDIVFFLLATFVMVSLSMVKNDGVPVRLPVAATGTAEDRRSATTITVAESGEVFLDKEPVTVDVLKTRLAALKEADADLKVFINGDQRAEFGRAVEILDEVRALGIQKVSIQTKKKT